MQLIEASEVIVGQHVDKVWTALYLDGKVRHVRYDAPEAISQMLKALNVQFKTLPAIVSEHPPTTVATYY